MFKKKNGFYPYIITARDSWVLCDYYLLAWRSSSRRPDRALALFSIKCFSRPISMTLLWWSIKAGNVVSTDQRNFINDAGIPAITWEPGWGRSYEQDECGEID